MNMYKYEYIYIYTSVDHSSTTSRCYIMYSWIDVGNSENESGRGGLLLHKSHHVRVATMARTEFRYEQQLSCQVVFRFLSVSYTAICEKR